MKSLLIPSILVAQVPSGIGPWVLALSPIVMLAVLLIGLRWKAAEAGPIGLLIAVVAAVTVFGIDLRGLAVAIGLGVWDSISILLVVWAALLLYRVTDRAGAQEALRHGLGAFSRNDLFLVLGFGWVFASFLQGITGFGTPVAVVAPLLVALGVKPVYAVVVPLIGHAWANLFGTLGVAWLGTQQVLDLDDPVATAVDTAALLLIPVASSGLAIAWLYGRLSGVRLALPMIVVIAVIHGGGQLLLSRWDPLLAAFVPATVALLALYPLSLWSRYSEPARDVDDHAIMADERSSTDEDEPEPVMGTGMAMMPYIILTVVAVGTLVLPPIRDLFEQVEMAPRFGSVETDLGINTDGDDDPARLTPLTHPALFLGTGTLVAGIVYRRRNFYQRWAEQSGARDSMISEVADDATDASVAIVSFLALSSVMSVSGQTDTLAEGVASIAPGGVYTLLAAWIGLLGSFMTTSNTSSNVLFSPLQASVADAQGLSQSAIIAGQHAGGAVGNSIAPANVVLGTGTAGISGKEGQVLRRVLPWTLPVTALVGLGTLALELAA
jgi:lactate permease